MKNVIRTFACFLIAVMFSLSSTFLVSAKGEKPPKPGKPELTEVSQDNGNKPEKKEYDSVYVYSDGGFEESSSTWINHTVETPKGFKYQNRGWTDYVYTDPFGQTYSGWTKYHSSYSYNPSTGQYSSGPSHGSGGYNSPVGYSHYRYICHQNNCTYWWNGDKIE